MKSRQSPHLLWFSGLLLAVLGVGCEAQPKPVLKIETPGTTIEVDRTPGRANVEVQTTPPVDKTP